MKEYTTLSIEKNSTVIKSLESLAKKKNIKKTILLEKVIKIGIYEILKNEQIKEFEWKKLIYLALSQAQNLKK